MKKTIKLKKEDILPLLEGMIKDVKGEVSESYSGSEIGKFVGFALNYDRNFIKNIWGEESSISKHLEGKFQSAYDKVGSYGAMIAFYSMLDSENRDKLEAYIKNR